MLQNIIDSHQQKKNKTSTSSNLKGDMPAANPSCSKPRCLPQWSLKNSSVLNGGTKSPNSNLGIFNHQPSQAAMKNAFAAFRKRLKSICFTTAWRHGNDLFSDGAVFFGWVFFFSRNRPGMCGLIVESDATHGPNPWKIHCSVQVQDSSVLETIAYCRTPICRVAVANPSD